MREFELFTEDSVESVPAVRKSVKGKDQYKNKIRRALGVELFKGLELELTFGIPIVSSFSGPLPSSWAPFCKRKGKSESGIHFFSYDYTFNSVLTSPEKYLENRKNYPVVVAPDFSQYMDMPACVRFTNSYTNKALAAYWQKNGVNVIANVTWSDPESYEYSIAGQPHGSIVAINSNGAMKYNFSKYLWKRGYDYVVSHLEPSVILRFGPKMPGEIESISIYVENEYLNSMRYGR